METILEQLTPSPARKNNRRWHQLAPWAASMLFSLTLNWSASAQSNPLPSADPKLVERAQALHKRAIVIDTHNDITSAILDEGFDLNTPTGKTHTDLPGMLKGGLSAEFFSIYVSREYAEDPVRMGSGSASRALDMIDITYQQVERHADKLTLATTAQEIRAAKKKGKIAILMGIEGGHAIENSLFTLRSFHRLGIRYMTLTHSNTNDWCDSAGTGDGAVAKHGGLSNFGEKVVLEMQRLGMLVDVSHISDEAFFDVIRIAKAPVIASHSSARAIADHPRNMSDEMLKSVQQNGGIVMVNFYNLYIDPVAIAAEKERSTQLKPQLEALREQYKLDRRGYWQARQKLYEAHPIPATSLSVLIDHIDHITKVAGVDHVGLGSDFDGVPLLPQGIERVELLPNITLALLQRGYSEQDVLKILGENFLRVMEKAEAYARSTKTTWSGSGDTSRIERKKTEP